MPNMSGLEAAKELRSRYGHTFKVFVLTGNVMIKNCPEIATVTDGVLTKPCTKKELLEICLSKKTTE